MRANAGQECRDDLLTTELSSRDILVMEGERHRLARELHDGPLQTLTTLGLRLELCRQLSRKNDSAALEDELAQLKVDLQKSTAHLRDLMTQWRCPTLEEDSLRQAIERCVRNYQDGNDIEVALDLKDLPDHELGIEQKVALFRILQEALRNASQHSGASTVWVRAAMRSGSLQVHIEDNGRGFNLLGVTAKYPRQGLGLAGMQERARAIDGELQVDSQAGRGTGITLSVPWPGSKG